MERAAGVLMHITSLSSPYGIGTLGKQAYDFADFLKHSGQTYWQILPIGPTSYGDSPYQSFSTYAGNPYLIDFEVLCEQGLLKKSDFCDMSWGDDCECIDYKKIYDSRFAVLREAYKRFKRSSNSDFNKFKQENDFWINDYSLYMAVKSYFGMKSWTQWEDKGIRLREVESIKNYTELLKDDIQFWEFVQFIFFNQWNNLKLYVNSLGLKIIGDIPIYVAMDSADTWSNPQVFWLDSDNFPVKVAGCPPDDFSKKGQLWGNPLYNWDYLKKTNYSWWISRIKGSARFFDVTRIDHFRGFDSYYAISYPSDDATNGIWMEGPGIGFFNVMKSKLGDLPIIAEDLGFLTPGVVKLLKETGYPGMKILQFAFDSRDESDYLPHCYTSNSVVYTGTHDNETIIEWTQTVLKEDFELAKNYAVLTKNEGYNWGLIRTAYSSVSDLAIIPMQDFLGLDGKARMNTPSTLGGNWVWRIQPEVLTKKLSKRIRELTKLYGRVRENIDVSKGNARGVSNNI